MALHSWATMLCTILYYLYGPVQTLKRISFKEAAKVALSSTAAILFINLSLMYNSVGTYQVLNFHQIITFQDFKTIMFTDYNNTSIYIIFQNYIN